MEMIFLMLVCLLGGLRETEAMSVTGVLGKQVTVKCSHVNAFSNVKYFCKETCENVLISSGTKKKDSNGKYSISDEGNVFYVTISRLTEDDSGTYWCGIERYAMDSYNKVDLTVTKGNIKDLDDNLNDLPQSILNETINTKTSSSRKLVYIGVGLGVVVLTLAVVLLIFCRHRSRDLSTSSEMIRDTVYTTPLCQKQDAHRITTSSSTANGDQDTDLRTNGIFSSLSVKHEDIDRHHTDKLYSNISSSSESHIHPDSLCYSTLSFDKHTDCSTVIPHTAAVTYSTVHYMSADESTLYCNV